MFKKIIAVIVCAMMIIIPTSVSAQELEGKVMSLEYNQKAPYAGILLDPIAASKMIVDRKYVSKEIELQLRKEFQKDLEAADILNISSNAYRSATGRLSNIDVNTIRNNIFRPITLSDEVRRAFAENAARIGVTNPLIEALPVISQLSNEMRTVNLSEPSFPFFENPLLPITQDTSVTPQTLNLPGIDANIVNNPNAAGSFSNLTTAQKLQILFPQG